MCFCFQPSRIFADPNPTEKTQILIPNGGRVVGLPQAIAQDNLNDVISNIAALWAPEARCFFFFQKRQKSFFGSETCSGPGRSGCVLDVMFV